MNASKSANLLMLPDVTLQGQRRVGVTIRPTRLVYLVDPSDQLIALAAIDAACLQWGGSYQFLIPCARASRPSKTWETILERHDPDVVLDLVGADSSYLARHSERWDRVVLRWERPTETMMLVGATVFSALRRWKRVSGESAAHSVLHLTPLRAHPLALPLAFSLGHFDFRPMDGQFVIHEPYETWQHYTSSFFTVVERDPKSVSEEQLRALIIGDPGAVIDAARHARAGGSTDYYGIPSLTRLGAPGREPSHGYYGEDGPPPEVVQHDEAYYRRVLVLGEPGSVPDLCLAWNLRAQRMTEWGFPIWVAPSWLDDANLRDQIRSAMRRSQAGLLERGEPVLHVVSASLSFGQLTCVAARYGDLPLTAHDPAVLPTFFSPDFRVGPTTDSIVVFTDGQAEISLPDYRELADFDQWEAIAWSVEVDGYRMPRVSRLHLYRLGAGSRLAGDGITGRWSVLSGGPGTLLRVGVASGWDVLRGAASQGGYIAAVSDKGRRAMAVLNFFEPYAGLGILASRRVYRLLEDMASVVPRQAMHHGLARLLRREPSENEVAALVSAIQAGEIAGGQVERHHRDWSQLRNALGGDISQSVAETIVKWLVARRILLRGFTAVCPNCALKRWYPVDRLGERLCCDGCLTESPMPVPVAQVHWRYRLNEVIAQAVDQGALPQVLALGRFAEGASLRRVELIGGVPGVSLTPAEGVDAPTIEVDLLGVCAGRIVVGECKQSGAALQEAEVERLASLAHRLECSRLVLATTTDFDSAHGAIECARKAAGAIPLEVWQADNLFERGRSPGEHLESIARSLS